MSDATEELVDEELVSMLLAEDKWRPLHLSEKVEAAATPAERKRAENLAYLEAEVFPVLVPAIHELLELVQREHELGDAAKPKSMCISTAHKASGASNPIDWLGQFLMRHNPKLSGQGEKLAKEHPYCVLYRAQQQRLAQPAVRAAQAMKKNGSF